MRHWMGQGVGFHFELFSPWTWLVLITSILEVNTDLMHTHVHFWVRGMLRSERKDGIPFKWGRGGERGGMQSQIKYLSPHLSAFHSWHAHNAKWNVILLFFPSCLMSCSLKRVDQREERVTCFFKRSHIKSPFSDLCFISRTLCTISYWKNATDLWKQYI